MRHSGSVTPPLSSRGGASSPPPPSQQQPQQPQPPPQPQPPHRLGSPAAHATASERDPFLAQTAGIPLTEQDRQEGYDVELLNARPRGRYSSDLAANAGLDTDDDSLRSGREKYVGGGVAPVASHHGPPLAPGLAAPLAAGAGTGAGSAAAAAAALGAPGGIALGPIGSGPQYAYGGIDSAPVAYNKEYLGAGGGGAGGGGTAGSASGGGDSGTTAVSGRRKPWFLRPLPLLLVIGVIIGVALAVGLGVGLSQHHSGKSNNLAASASSGDRNSTSSRTSRSRSIGSTGTVVPSSLYSAYTSEHPQSTTEAVSIVVESAITTTNGTITTATFVTSVPAPANGTTLATTGNRPVPAASSTMINGTVLSALTSAFAAETGRRRRR
ncbi:hypothetical protein JCM3774_000024 [Rhodotorula dairenensis]